MFFALSFVVCPIAEIDQVKAMRARIPLSAVIRMTMPVLVATT